MATFKVGDLVRVWSLQSFSGGGFLDGEQAVIMQGNANGEKSVLVKIRRMIDGKYQIDTAYEVYPEQCRHMIEPPTAPQTPLMSETITWIPFALVTNEGLYLIKVKNERGSFVPGRVFCFISGIGFDLREVNHYGNPLFAAKYPVGPDFL